MRRLGCFVLALLLVALAAGPALAAPLPVSSGPHLSTPASHGSSGLHTLLNLLATATAFGIVIRKDTGTLAKKFTQRATAASGDYKDGVAAAGNDWATNTAASGDNWAQGTQAAIADQRFSKGVAAAGPQKFIARATGLGAQRYGPGVQAAEADWAKGVQSSLDVLKGLNLPPRAPKGDPRNQARSNAVATALRAHKVGK